MKTPHVRHGFAGITWSLVFVYLLAEVFTAMAWKKPYSFRADTISDLGVTTCSATMCSPMHLVMNAAFVILGVATIVGAILLREFIPEGYRRKSVLTLAVITGLSTAATGLFPSNDGVG